MTAGDSCYAPFAAATFPFIYVYYKLFPSDASVTDLKQLFPRPTANKPKPKSESCTNEK